METDRRVTDTWSVSAGIVADLVDSRGGVVGNPVLFGREVLYLVARLLGGRGALPNLVYRGRDLFVVISSTRVATSSRADRASSTDSTASSIVSSVSVTVVVV